jgi:hypothetical protein
MKQPNNCDNFQFQPFRLWMEQYWQPPLWAEDLEFGNLAVLVQQGPPLLIRHPFMFTLGAVETVGFLSNAAGRGAGKFGVGYRYH